MSLAADWFRQISDPDDRVAREQAIRQAGPILEILKDLLTNRLRTASQMREASYEHPSWAYLQAHRNGRIEDLEYVIKLLTL